MGFGWHQDPPGLLERIICHLLKDSKGVCPFVGAAEILELCKVLAEILSLHTGWGY